MKSRLGRSFLALCCSPLATNALLKPSAVYSPFAALHHPAHMFAPLQVCRERNTRRQHQQMLQPSMSLDVVRVAETFCPRIGVVTSSALYFSPAVAVLAAVRKNSLDDLNPLPLAFMAISATAWLIYGLSINDRFVALSNIAGCVASISYVIGVLPLIKEQKTLRTTQSVVISGAAASLSLWTYLILSSKSAAQRSSILGAFASGLFCIMSASPLSTMGSVIREKNASSILGPFALAQVSNTALWSAYGLSIKDAFVWGPNSIGLGLGLAQLLLKLMFPSKKQDMDLR